MTSKPIQTVSVPCDPHGHANMRNGLTTVTEIHGTIVLDMMQFTTVNTRGAVTTGHITIPLAAARQFINELKELLANTQDQSVVNVNVLDEVWDTRPDDE